MNVRRRVAAGVALLDEKIPGWWRDDHEPPIGLHSLNLGSFFHCVLGQLCPLEDAVNRFWDMACLLTETPGDDQREILEDQVIRWAADHGFTLGRDPVPTAVDALEATWRALTDEWRRVITERRGAAGD